MLAVFPDRAIRPTYLVPSCFPIGAADIGPGSLHSEISTEPVDKPVDYVLKPNITP